MRLPGWEAALAAAVDDARSRPFQWGAHDCATWAFDVRRALTGQDAAQDWRGRYSTAKGAAKVLRRLGFDSLAGLSSAIMGDAIQPLSAQRGDIVLCEAALGVCVGSMAVFVAESGLTARPLSGAAMAWRV